MIAFDSEEMELAKKGVFQNNARKLDYENMLKHPGDYVTTAKGDVEIKRPWDFRALVKTVIVCAILIYPIYWLSVGSNVMVAAQWSNVFTDRDMAELNREFGKTTTPAIKADAAAKAKGQRADKKPPVEDEAPPPAPGTELSWGERIKGWSVATTGKITGWVNGNPAVVPAAPTKITAPVQSPAKAQPKAPEPVQAKTPVQAPAAVIATAAPASVNKRQHKAPEAVPVVEATPELDDLNSRLDSLLSPNGM